MPLVDYLGPELAAGHSTVPTSHVMQAEWIGLYFSAHWCGPCRNFTPTLAKCYSYLRSQGMQIIYVSSDHNEGQFQEYYSEMPWKAMPFSRDRSALQTRFNVQGIPALIILRADAKVATTKGVDLIRGDPTGQTLMNKLQQCRQVKPSEAAQHVHPRRRETVSPTMQPPMLQWIGPELLSGRSTVPTAAVLKSAKSVGLYFSAHWCGPCRNFTPLLASKYGTLRAQGMQIVFVSSDHNENSFMEYYAEMPWKAVPFSRDRAQLQSKFGIQGIPALVVLHMDGRVATAQGVDILRSDPSGQTLLHMLQ